MMQQAMITGNCGRDPELRTTQSGDKVCAVNVGVRQGWGEKASTNWFRCNVWGKRADTVAEHIRKGMKVTVVGELTIGEYQGKPQYDLRVNDIDWSAARQEQAGGMTGGSSGFRNTPQPVDDLSDEIPF